MRRFPLVLPAVLAAVALSGPVAAPAQQSASGAATVDKVAASPFGSSLLVTVGCADRGSDCQGDVRARTTTKIRGRTRSVGSLPFSVFPGEHETLRFTLTRSVRTRLRRTGRLGVRVVLTDGSGVAARIVRTTVHVKPRHG